MSAQTRSRWITGILTLLATVLVARSAAEAFQHNLPRLLFEYFPIISLILVLLATAVVWRGLSKGHFASNPRRFKSVAILWVFLAGGAFLGLVLGFASRTMPIGETKEPMRIITSWRALTDMEPEQCAEVMGVGRLDACWDHREVIVLGLDLSYLGLLATIGMIAGVFLVDPRGIGRQQAPQSHLDLRLRLESKGDGEYFAHVQDDEGRDESATFRLPEELQKAEGFYRALQEPTRSSEALAEAAGLAPDTFGGKLFETVFQGTVRDVLLQALHQRSAAGLRIRLNLEAVPELAVLPWEYLYDQQGKGFFASSLETPVIRSLDSIQPYPPLEVESRLRILVVTAQPENLPRLGVDQEIRDIRKSLRWLRWRRRVAIEPLPSATWEKLHTRLADTQKKIHVLHFIGHGGRTDQGKSGLAFETPDGGSKPTTGEPLAQALLAHGSIRLVVLNACHGAQGKEREILAGLAQTLLKRNLPAVLAMQASIRDSTARTFARFFYQALALGDPVDVALGRARNFLQGQGNEEWGVPVLYLRARDGRLFRGPSSRTGWEEKPGT